MSKTEKSVSGGGKIQMQATRRHNPISVPFPRSPLFLMLSYLGKISLSGETVLLKAKDYILFNPKSPPCLVYKRWPINHRTNAVTVKPVTTKRVGWGLGSSNDAAQGHLGLLASLGLSVFPLFSQLPPAHSKKLKKCCYALQVTFCLLQLERHLLFLLPPPIAPSTALHTQWLSVSVSAATDRKLGFSHRSGWGALVLPLEGSSKAFTFKATGGM